MIDDMQLYPADYKEKDPRAFLYKYPSYVQPVKLSKSINNYLKYSTLELMTATAAHQEKIVVPFACFTWKRIRALKDLNIFHFKIGKEPYFMICELDLKKIEKDKLDKYLSDLKWNYTTFELL